MVRSKSGPEAKIHRIGLDLSELGRSDKSDKDF